MSVVEESNSYKHDILKACRSFFVLKRSLPTIELPYYSV